MNFETFRGRDVKEALALVRAAYGEDAIIGSTRVVSNGRDGALSQSFVEVKAGPSDAPAGLPVNQRAFPFARADAQRNAAALSPSHRPAPAPAFSMKAKDREANAANAAKAMSPLSESRADAVENEVRALRMLVERMLEKKAPKDRALVELNAAGVEGKLATDLSSGIAKAQKDGDSKLTELLRERLEKRVICTEIVFEIGQKRMIACVGPTGSGKTTTLAKLAAHAHLEKSLDVAIITLDTFRVGAVEQMRRFASLIGVPFAVANDEASLARAFEGAPDIVFIDTPSRGPRDEAAMGRLAACLAHAGPEYARDVLLAIPAHTRAADAEDLVRAYRPVAPTACVITKLDETLRPGGAVAGAIQSKLEIAFLCKGPRVPEDLVKATPSDVAFAVLPSSKAPS